MENFLSIMLSSISISFFGRDTASAYNSPFSVAFVFLVIKHSRNATSSFHPPPPEKTIDDSPRRGFDFDDDPALLAETRRKFCLLPICVRTLAAAVSVSSFSFEENNSSISMTMIFRNKSKRGYFFETMMMTFLKASPASSSSSSSFVSRRPTS